MIYFLYVVPNIIFDIIALLLNPIVILFTKSDGNLPKYLYWFQTHDHVLFFDDDLIQTNWPELVNIKPSWLKLYLCRLFWLYRNTGYAFAYNVLGYDYTKDNLYTKKTTVYDFAYDKSKPISCRGWKLFLFYKYPFYQKLGLRVYLGWKIDTDNTGRAMLAMHINPFRKSK